MTIVETPWKWLYRLFLFFFGLIFLTPGVAFFIIEGIWIFLLTGILLEFIGIGCYIKDRTVKRQLKTLRDEGKCIEANVVNIVLMPWVRIGTYVTARVDCAYQVEEGERVVKSGYLLLTPFDKIEALKAKVYFDRSNSAKYRVELFR